MHQLKVEKMQAQKYILDIPVQSELKPGMHEFPVAVLTTIQEDK